jgi:hypothetical protein
MDILKVTFGGGPNHTKAHYCTIALTFTSSYLLAVSVRLRTRLLVFYVLSQF